jgi:nucleoside-diphosphate-sugar epimerase
MEARTALIVGVTGIAGRNLAEHLLQAGGWTVHGLARHPETAPDGVRPVAADLRDAASVREALAGMEPTHVFLTTWSRQATEARSAARARSGARP